MENRKKYERKWLYGPQSKENWEIELLGCMKMGKEIRKIDE